MLCSGISDGYNLRILCWVLFVLNVGHRARSWVPVEGRAAGDGSEEQSSSFEIRQHSSGCGGSDSVYAPNAIACHSRHRQVPFLKFLWCFSIFLHDLRKKCVFCSICFCRNYQPVSQEKFPPGICALLVLIAQARQSLWRRHPGFVLRLVYAVSRVSSLFYPRRYGERQKIMAVLVEGQFMEVFLTPQNLGEGIFSRVVAAGRSNLHVRDIRFGPRLKHLCFFLLTAHHIYIYLPRNGGRLHKHLHFNWPTFFLLLRFPLHAPNTQFCVGSAVIHARETL